MNVLVISANRSLLPVPVIPFGACMIAEAAERAGHNVKFVDLMFEADPLRAAVRAIEDARPDLIGISVRNIDNNDMQNPVFYVQDIVSLIERIRDVTEAEIVLGGAALGVMPEEILRFTGIRLAVTGDGEVVFPELLRMLSEGKSPRGVAGLAAIEEGVFIDNRRRTRDCPHVCATPDFARWLDIRRYLSRLSSVPVQTKLGCHFKCVYCTYRKIEGGGYRLSPPEEAADSIERLVSSGFRDIEFVDNVFNSPYGHAFALCETLAVRKLPVRLCSLELNPAMVDDALIEMMQQAGFVAIGITAESASDKVLEALGKGYFAEDVARAADCVSRHSLPCLWIFLLGGPGETESTVRETLRFAEKRIRPGDTAFFNIGVRVYPGTELENIARKQGIVSPAADNMLPPVFYLSPEVDKDWLCAQVRHSLDAHMNFIDSGSLGLNFLPSLHRLSHGLGIKSPLWRYTRFIRRGLRFAGIDA